MPIWLKGRPDGALFCHGKVFLPKGRPRWGYNANKNLLASTRKIKNL